MTRTTLSLDNRVFDSLQKLAKKENRSTPNLIETILIRYLNEDFYIDDAEMNEINQDTSLKKDLKKAWSEYKKGQGRFA